DGGAADAAGDPARAGLRRRRRRRRRQSGSPVSLLKIDGLRVRVAGHEILHGVDLEVRSGEVHALMGPNGSGKSTLSHALMGRPDYEVIGGSITIDGEDVTNLPTWQ